MGETYACTFANCVQVFSKAYELKKHKATHDDPDSVFYCSECDFITLQKKNLTIHFALHTGEKIHECPDMIDYVRSSRLAAREERCEYRTNDPAALSRHRKKDHGYVPPPNRTRPAKATPAVPRKPRQKMDEKVSRCRRHSQRPLPVSHRKLSRLPRKVNNFNGVPDYSTTSAQSPKIYFPRQEAMDGGAMDVDFYEQFGHDSSGTTLIGSDEEIGTILHDLSLRSQWMAMYEEGYSTFDMSGMKHLPGPLHVIPPLSSASLCIQTGREGCLCPEWMVEAGIEGWDQSVLETHEEYCMFDA